MRKTFAALILFALAALPIAGQLPSTTDPLFSNTRQKTYLKTRTFSRTVTVDYDGRGMFSTVKDALLWVAEQERTPSTQFLVLVYPGQPKEAAAFDDWYNFAESAWSIPSYTTVQGVVTSRSVLEDNFGRIQVLFTASSGPLITMAEGSHIANLDFLYYGLPGGALTFIDATGSGAATLTNVGIMALPLANTHAVTVIRNAAANLRLRLFDCNVTLGGLASAGSVLVANTSSGRITIDGGALYGDPCGTAVASSGAGGVNVEGVRFTDVAGGGACSVDLATSGAGTIRVSNSSYLTKSGSGISHSDIILSGTTVPASCQVGQLFLDTDTGPAICVCSALNTWKCATVS